MKIKLKFSIVLIICLFSFILKGERINNYEVIVQINKDRSVTVNEVIYYDMDSTEKHGIYRYIPLKAKEGRKKEFLSMNYIRRNGKPEYYKGERYEDGMTYRIGSPKKFLDRKVHRYEIDYTLFNAINEQDKIYQLYFNVIPQFWEVPIEKVDITIIISKNGIIERKEIEDLNKSLMYYIQEKQELENRLRNLYIITQEEHTVMEEKTINLNPDKLGITSMWFNYRKIHPHSGTDVVLVKYKDGIIEFESGLLFYDMKKKKVFTKYFTEAKSYPIGSTSRKYYYYDKDVSISIGDIDIIVDKVNSLCLNKK